MTVVVKFKVDSALAEEYFIFAGYRARDMREPFRDVAKMTVSMVHQQFITEGERMLGHRWEALSEPYGVMKELKFPDKGILERTGLMRKGATDLFDPLLLRITRDSMTYKPSRRVSDGTDLVEVHTMGREPMGINKDGEPSGQMPSRPIFNDSEEWYRHVEEIFTHWLAELAAVNRRRTGAGIIPSAPAPVFVL